MKQYKLYYSAWINNETIKRSVVITATDPISALDQFHKQMQLTESSMVTSGVVTRPKLTPSQYKVLGLYQYYADSPRHLGGSGEMVESKIDLPNTPNPDLRKQPSLNRQDVEMEFDLNDERRPAN